MNMNTHEVKAFIHRNRIADVVDALYLDGFRNLTVIDVQGLLKALDTKEQRYSVEIGQKVITEVKLELVCEGENRTAEAVELILSMRRPVNHTPVGFMSRACWRALRSCDVKKTLGTTNNRGFQFESRGSPN